MIGGFFPGGFFLWRATKLQPDRFGNVFRGVFLAGHAMWFFHFIPLGPKPLLVIKLLTLQIKKIPFL